MRNSTPLAALALAAALAGTAEAQVLQDCEVLDSITAVVEPWEEATRSYANGAIRVVHLDTDGEPVCCSSHLAIVAPTGEPELPFRQCRLLSDADGFTGFLDVRIAEIASSYDPAKGLLLTVPVDRYDGEKGARADGPFPLRVRINQATGAITLE